MASSDPGQSIPNGTTCKWCIILESCILFLLTVAWIIVGYMDWPKILQQHQLSRIERTQFTEPFEALGNISFPNTASAPGAASAPERNGEQTRMSRLYWD